MNLKRATTVHLLGNGPSVRHFETDLFHDEPTDGIRVGCNLSYPHLAPAWTFITIRPLFWLCTHNYSYTIPLCVDKNVLLTLKDVLPDPNRLREFEYWQVIEQRPDTKQSVKANFSSGHMATVQAIRTYNPTILHLWGFDSMWNSSIDSVQDEYSYTKSIDSRLWWSFWIEIFNSYPKTKFVIHAPIKIHNVPPNVQIILL